MTENGKVYGWGQIHDEFTSDVPKELPLPDLAQGDSVLRARIGTHFVVYLTSTLVKGAAMLQSKQGGLYCNERSSVCAMACVA